MVTTLDLPRPHGFLIWRGKQKAIAVPEKLEFDSYLIISDGEAFGVAQLAEPAQMKVSVFDTKEWFDLHCIYADERRRYWPEADKFYVYKISDFKAFEAAKPYANGRIIEQQFIGAQEQELIAKAKRLPKTIVLDENVLALSDGKFVAKDGVATDEIKAILKATYENEPEFITESNSEELPLYQLALVRNPRLRMVKKKLQKQNEEADDMPFPNEHASRQRSPEGCKRVRRQNDKLGDGIHAIFCVKDDDTTELQSIRFDNSKFTPAEARAWLKEHDMNTNLEEATGEEKSTKMYDEEMPMSYVPFGVTSFADLAAAEQAQMNAHQVHGLTSQLQSLVKNIMVDPEIEDKQEALRNLVFEFGMLVNEAMTATTHKKWQPLTNLAKKVIGAFTGKVEPEPVIDGLACKTVNGDLWHFTWSTNAFMDRDQEIFSTKALETYVSESAKNGNRGSFDFWHIPGTDFAEKRWQGVIGRFLVEAGPYLDNEAGKCAKTFFKKYPSSHPAIAPEGWGASPEFRFLPEDREDSIFDHLWITKTSTLPRYAAANIWTEGKQIMLSDEQRKAAVEIFGESFVKQIEADGEKRTQELEAAGIAHKEMQEQAPETSVKPQEQVEPAKAQTDTPAEAIDVNKLAEMITKQFALDTQPFGEALAQLATELKTLGSRLEKLEKTEALKAKVETPRFTFGMLQRASEAVETKVQEGDGLKENAIGSALLREGESVASRLFTKNKVSTHGYETRK